MAEHQRTSWVLDITQLWSLVSVIHCAVLSHVIVTPWTVAHQAPLSMEFSRQEHWGGRSFPSQENLPDPGIKPGSPVLQANSLPA